MICSLIRIIIIIIIIFLWRIHSWSTNFLHVNSVEYKFTFFYLHHFILISFTKRRKVGFEFTVVSVGLFMLVTSKFKAADPLPCSLLWILRMCLQRTAYKLNFQFLTTSRKKMADLRTCEAGAPLGPLSFESRNYQFQVKRTSAMYHIWRIWHLR
jgi:hypothetical protein